MAPLAETLSYSNSILKINLGIANHKIQRYNGTTDTSFEMKAKYFTGLEKYVNAVDSSVLFFSII